MILPETLSPKSKRFLLRRYGVDVEDGPRFERRYRRALILVWIFPFLAAGLLWDSTLGPLAYRPVEITIWCLLGFLIADESFLWIYHWRQT